MVGSALYPTIQSAIDGAAGAGVTVGAVVTVKSGVMADAPVDQGTGVSVPLVSVLPRPYKSGEVLTFSGGGVLTLMADAATGSSVFRGDLTTTKIVAGETLNVAVAQGTEVSVPVTALHTDYFLSLIHI